MTDSAAQYQAPASDLQSPKQQALTTFIALLEHEQQVLGNPQVETLEAIAAAKQELVSELHILCGSPHYVTASATADEPQIPALARRAQRLNAINATLLAMHRTACESRLRMLRGGERDNTLYRSNGYLGL